MSPISGTLNERLGASRCSIDFTYDRPCRIADAAASHSYPLIRISGESGISARDIVIHSPGRVPNDAPMACQGVLGGLFAFIWLLKSKMASGQGCWVADKTDIPGA